MREVCVGERYRHFKGNIYVVIAIAVHTETMETMVIYQDEQESDKIWARPLEMFNSEVDHEKYPNEINKYRFTKIETE